ncbi:MAG: hypothetical protein MUF51_09780 [Vicinamibacteria bacterium]|nr:hypothetical protein [Vicinamibacteria bacterium]
MNEGVRAKVAIGQLTQQRWDFAVEQRAEEQHACAAPQGVARNIPPLASGLAQTHAILPTSPILHRDRAPVTPASRSRASLGE